MQILTPDQVTEQENEAKAKALDNMRYEPPKVVDNLAGHVKSCWEHAQHERTELESRMLDCLRRRRGQYSSQKLADIRQMGGAEVYMRITSAKCAAAKSWLTDIFSQSQDKPFSVDPTPNPELPPDLKMKLITQAVQGAVQFGVPMEQMNELIDKHADRLRDELKEEARKKAERMSEKVLDVLTEGGWREQFSFFIDDLVTYPSAIFKGPVYRRKKRLKWVDAGSGEFVPNSDFEVIREFRRVSPFDFYPSPASVNVNDDWVIERHRLTASDLSAMRGAAGYNGQGIAMALNDYRVGGLKEWASTDAERDRLEGREKSERNTLIEALEWSGKLQGKMLLEWGMNSQSIPDPLEEYLVSVMVVGDYVIRCLVNPDPTDQMDYFKASWRDIPNSFFGEALPEQLADCQDMANASARALANNMAIASGPMVYYMADRLAPGQDVSKLHPWKVFGATESRTGSTAQPVGFFQPSSNAQELMAIYERFNSYADDITGLPAYAYGSDQGSGAARTASGLSMLMNAASKSVKQVVRNIDIGVIEPIVRKVYNHLMLDPTIDKNCKGDLQIRAMGSDRLIHKEAIQQMQQNFLMQTGNPMDMQIVGMEGRRALLHELAKNLDIPANKIVPSEEELQLRMMEQQQQQMMMQQQQEENPNAG